MAEENRRSFIKWAIHGLGAIFALVLGLPVILYLIDPRHRAARGGDLRRVDDIDLTELQTGIPRQGIIRDVRRDAWTLHPSDVVGRVWVVKHGAGRDDIFVFTTVCPHLGCSINQHTSGAVVEGFACPCHNGQFDLNGNKTAGNNPAPRGMDKLTWQRDPVDEKRLLVRYVNFRQGETEPIEKT